MPWRLALKNNNAWRIPAENILLTAEAHDYYFREQEKRLTGPHHFGFDPLHENIQIKEIRTRRFYEIFLNAEHIFTKLNLGDVVYFENAICLFQNLTVALSKLWFFNCKHRKTMTIVFKDSLFIANYVLLIRFSQTIAMNSHKTPIRLRWFLWITTIRASVLLNCAHIRAYFFFI